MRTDEFYQSRKSDWEALSHLLEQSQKDMRGLSESQVRDLARLYRAATSDLALAKRDFPRNEITAYLNQLVARAHAVVYRSEPLALKRLWRFAATGFPRLFRETWMFTFIAALLFIIPAIAAGISTFVRPETATLLLPSQLHRLIGVVEDKELWIDIPVLKGFNFQGGLRLTPEFGAMLVGLTMYTAAFIAEVVRSGIQAVHKGQVEAARALGLRNNQLLGLVVIPQALRVVIPPLISQYLNLTKNSSLALTIGYQELFAIGKITINQAGRAVPIFIMVMATYLFLSLFTSILLNIYNRRVQFVEK